LHICVCTQLSHGQTPSTLGFGPSAAILSSVVNVVIDPLYNYLILIPQQKVEYR